jgi:hypothetical protein
MLQVQNQLVYLSACDILDGSCDFFARKTDEEGSSIEETHTNLFYEVAMCIWELLLCFAPLACSSRDCLPLVEYFTVFVGHAPFALYFFAVYSFRPIADFVTIRIRTQQPILLPQNHIFTL